MPHNFLRYSPLRKATNQVLATCIVLARHLADGCRAPVSTKGTEMRNKTNRGSQGYNRIVDIVDGKPCTKLKRHYCDCPREVIGYLEVLAENDPERFVFASVPDIVKHCKN